MSEHPTIPDRIASSYRRAAKPFDEWEKPRANEETKKKNKRKTRKKNKKERNNRGRCADRGSARRVRNRGARFSNIRHQCTRPKSCPSRSHGIRSRNECGAQMRVSPSSSSG